MVATRAMVGTTAMEPSPFLNSMRSKTNDALTQSKEKQEIDQEGLDYLQLTFDQIKHSGMEGSNVDFVQQFAAMTGATESKKMGADIRKLQETFIPAVQAQTTMLAALLPGRTVELDLNQAVVAKDSKLAEFNYYIPEEASSCKLQVIDPWGHVVHQSAGQKDKGLHSLAWDLKTEDNERVFDGKYTLKVNAKDSRGAEIKAPDKRASTIDSVVGSDSMVVGGKVISIGSEMKFGKPEAAAAA